MTAILWRYNKMTLTLAIAGRPNVGKSTLFNRLIGKSMAIVSDTPGVTRDWREGDGVLFDRRFRILDTAGLETVSPRGSIAERMTAQARRAIEESDVILFVVDARVGITPEDKTIANTLRKSGKPIILLANKCESTWLPPGFEELSVFGFGEAIALSAVHGDGLPDLYDALKKLKPAEPDEIVEKKSRRKKITDTTSVVDKPPVKAVIAETEESEFIDGDTIPDLEVPHSLNVAIVGRPNAGKSTLVNRLLGQERMLTGPEPGLTRDSIPTEWMYHGRPIRLVDTAGMRRRSRVENALERASVQESLRAIRLAHIVVLVLDATMPFDKQDLIIAHHVIEEGRALVVALNKWDTIRDKKETMSEIRYMADSSLSQVSGLQLVPLSALKGQGVEEMMKNVIKAYDIWNTRVSTGRLNRWLERVEDEHPPPITANRRIKLRYMTQLKSRPPTFGLWVNKPVDLPDSYVRFLTNGLRQSFELMGTPIRWAIKKSNNPYKDNKKTS